MGRLCVVSVSLAAAWVLLAAVHGGGGRTRRRACAQELRSRRTQFKPRNARRARGGRRTSVKLKILRFSSTFAVGRWRLDLYAMPCPALNCKLVSPSSSSSNCFFAYMLYVTSSDWLLKDAPTSMRESTSGKNFFWSAACSTEAPVLVLSAPLTSSTTLSSEMKRSFAVSSRLLPVLSNRSPLSMPARSRPPVCGGPPPLGGRAPPPPLGGPPLAAPPRPARLSASGAAAFSLPRKGAWRRRWRSY